MQTLRNAFLAVVAGSVVLVSAARAETPDAVVKQREARDTAIEAYIYAYPLVTMEFTRRALTNTVKPAGTKAPMGEFVRMREYPSAKFRVTAPNADTLYTTAWVDVSHEPWVLMHPGPSWQRETDVRASPRSRSKRC